MYFHAKEGLIAICLVLLSYCVQTVPAGNLNCYVTDNRDVSIVLKKDCHMHTGCMKRYDKRSQQVLEKSCFLTNGYNDTCFDDKRDANVGICWCHTDLCNSASRWTSSATSLSWLFQIIALMCFPLFAWPRM